MPPLEPLVWLVPGSTLDASTDAPVYLHYDPSRFRQTGEMVIRVLLDDGTVQHARRVRLTAAEVGPGPIHPERPAARCFVKALAPIEILE